MTALKQYEKLEAPGLWRETPDGQRREVYVGFGDTSLMIRDRNDDALAHWSLPAVRRLNPGEAPALYSPDPEGRETLEIEDSTMTDAIEKVRRAIDRRRPHPGRLRLLVLAGITAAVAALALFWLPGALIRHSVRVAPFETRQEIGNELMAQITRLAGRTCETPRGRQALDRLAERVLKGAPARIEVLAEGLAKATSLPGGIYILNKELVEDHEMPEVAAGYLLAEQLRREARDPLLKLLEQAGGLAAFRLLTTGHLSEATLESYARFLLTERAPLPADAALLERFARAGFSSGPLAFELDITGETTLTLIEADPFANRPYTPLLNDADWLNLQAICGA